MAAKPIIIKINADTKAGQAKIAAFTASLNAQMKTAQASTMGLNKGITSLNTVMTKGLRVAKRFAQAGILAVGAAFAYSVKVGAQFEYATQKVGNIAGATADQMELLASKARELGETTAYTATQVMDGMQSLASMGMTTDQVSDSIEHALHLAGTFGSDMATSASGIAIAIKNFGLAASDTEMIVDKFTATIQNSRFSGLEPMMGAFKEASANAGALGMELDDVLVGIKFFTDAGYEASRAGSMFNMAMRTAAKEMPKTVKALNDIGLSYDDIDPKAHGFIDIVEVLSKTTMDGAAAMDIFGGRAGLAFKKVIDIARETPDALSDATGNLTDIAGKTAKTYEDLMDTVIGWWKQLTSAVESAAQNVFLAYKDKLKATLEDMTGKIREFAEKLADPAIQQQISDFFGAVVSGAKLAGSALEGMAGYGAALADVWIELAKAEAEHRKSIKEGRTDLGLYGKAVLKLSDGFLFLAGKIFSTKEELKAQAQALKISTIQMQNIGASAIELYHAFKLAGVESEILNNTWTTDKGQETYKNWLANQEALNEKLATGKDMLGGVREKLEELGVDVDAIGQAFIDAGGSAITMGAELEAALPEDYQVVISFETNTIAIEKISEQIETAVAAGVSGPTTMSKALKMAKFIGDSSSTEFKKAFDKLPEQFKPAMEILRAQMRLAATLAGQEGIVTWESEIVKLAAPVAETLGKGFFDSTGTTSFSDWQNRIDSTLYETTKTAMEKAFVDTLISKQIIEPLVALLKDIDLNSQEGMNQIRAAYDTVRTKMEALYPVVETVTGFLRELAPASAAVITAQEAEVISAINTAQKIADMGGTIGLTNPTIAALALAADKASEELYKVGSGYASNTRNDDPFIEPVTFSAFSSGSEYVPRTGPAIVHEGERIVRSSEVTNNRPLSLTINIAGLLTPEMVENDIYPAIEELKKRVW